MDEIFIPISLFGMILGIVYLVIRKKERLALLEKGADASVFVQNKQSNAILKWGLFLMGVGIGLLIAQALVRAEAMDEEAAYFSMIFLFGGIALVISYFLDKKRSSSQ